MISYLKLLVLFQYSIYVRTFHEDHAELVSQINGSIVCDPSKIAGNASGRGGSLTIVYIQYVRMEYLILERQYQGISRFPPSPRIKLITFTNIIIFTN